MVGTWVKKVSLAKPPNSARFGNWDEPFSSKTKLVQLCGVGSIRPISTYIAMFFLVFVFFQCS
jgi:hypothetical protein